MKLSAGEFLASIDVDGKLYDEEIQCSRAHAKMLAESGYLDENEKDEVLRALDEIREEIEGGRLKLSVEDEDVHGSVDRFLIEKTGILGRKMKIARGVNDRVVADTRLFLKKEIRSIEGLLSELLDTLENLAREHVNTIMPGYSHLMRAQPVTLGYHILAYYQMFSRDIKRFRNCREGMNMMPPDCGALAGTVYETDRTSAAEELGFDGILPNAMDAVSDRDFCMEFINDCSITMMHLSRFCEDIILWSSVEFDFVSVDEKFTTTTRRMPNKNNLDVAELIRGKTGRVYGDMVNILTVFKGLPMSYNRDMQEDKFPVTDAADTLESSLAIFVEMIRTIKINRGNMQRAAKYGYMNSAELVEYLQEKGYSLTDSVAILEKVVAYAMNNGRPIEELWLDDLKQFSQMFDSDLYDRIAIRNVISSKKSYGSTSFESVEKQLEEIKKNK